MYKKVPLGSPLGPCGECIQFVHHPLNESLVDKSNAAIPWRNQS